MKIKILHLIEGAKQATGLTVIIDVFRAFSVACYYSGNGAKTIIPVGDIEIAYRLKKDNPDYILSGERGGKPPVGFDYGNSPTRIENVNFRGKTIVHTTEAGTQGIANAKNANEILTGGFVNLQAIVDYIKLRNPEEVSLVCMGDAGIHIADEDRLCAEFIRDTLEGKPTDFGKVVKKLRNNVDAKKLFDPPLEWFPETDFDLCLSLNKFNFVLKVEPYGDNLVHLKKIEQ